MVGLFSYIATIEFVPQWVYLLAFFAVIVRKAPQIVQYCVDTVQGKVSITLNAAIILLIPVFSVANFLFNRPDPFHTPGNFPYHVLLIPTIVIATQLNRRDLNIILGCLVFESLIAILEFGMGVSTIFWWSPNYLTFSDSSLLYFSRPHGLSANSSILAFKVLMGILIIRYHKMSGKKYRMMEALFLLIILLTFGRTVILAVLFFYLIYQIHIFGSGVKKRPASWLSYAMGTLVILTSAVFLVTLNIDTLIAQFTRNTGSIELSGREAIWAFFMQSFESSPALGNASLKLMWGEYHAHNSFLQLVSSNGLIIGFLFFLLILKNIRLKNAPFVITIMVYSMAQYGIFWGISLVDIIFYYFLLEAASSLNLFDAVRNFKHKYVENTQ